MLSHTDRGRYGPRVEAHLALAALSRRLTDAGFRVEHARIAGREALVGRRAEFRLRWIATRLHTFVVVFEVQGLDATLAEQLSAAAQQFSIDHKGGLPRGLQTGSATISVFLDPHPTAAVGGWFAGKPKHRFAALRLPVLADLGAGSVTYFTAGQAVGSLYASYLHGIVRDVVRPAIEDPSSAT